jgi:hypothetical protein
MAARNRFKILAPESRKKRKENRMSFDLVVTGNEQRIHMPREEKHN